jgi:hypothetical protein
LVVVGVAHGVFSWHLYVPPLKPFFFVVSGFHLLRVDEYKQAKILINTSLFLQFLLHNPMWCHFNGMLIMEICAY